MPVLPPFSTVAYDSVQFVLQTARAWVKDKMPTLVSYSGNLLDRTNADTQAMANAGWRRLQEFLTSAGFSALTGDTVIIGLPVCLSTDPSDQVFIAWSGCSDGINIYTAPTLPENLMYPLKVWERQSGIDMPFIEPPMELMLDGLPTAPKGILNRRWEWREDAIWVPGAQQITDLRIRYIKYMADFKDVGAVQWFDQLVPIVHASDALAAFIVAQVIGETNPVAAQAAVDAGEAAARKLINRDVKAKQRVNVRRQPRSGGGNDFGWQ